MFAPGSFRDDQQHTGAAVDRGVADEGLVVLHDGRHVGQGQTGFARESHLGQVGRGLDRRDVADGESLVLGLHKTPGARRGGLEEGER